MALRRRDRYWRAFWHKRLIDPDSAFKLDDRVMRQLPLWCDAGLFILIPGPWLTVAAWRALRSIRRPDAELWRQAQAAMDLLLTRGAGLPRAPE